VPVQVIRDQAAVDQIRNSRAQQQQQQQQSENVLAQAKAAEAASNAYTNLNPV
jgi:hypothetical protein